jgi:ABC-type phosphate transport system substrate-binding protein
MNKTIMRVCLPVVLLAYGLPAADPEPAVVVNKTNPLTTITRGQLKKILTGTQAKWPDGEKVVAMTPPSGSAERSGALQRFCGMTEQQLKEEMIHADFKGEERTPLRTMPSGKLIVSVVQLVHGAIGIVNAGDVTDQVKVVRVE